MKKFSKFAALLLAILMVATLFAGCGNSNTTTTPPASQAPASQAPESTAPATTDPTQESGTIELWMNPGGFQSDDLQQAWAQKCIDEFHQTYPNMKVNITMVPWADSATKKQLAMSTGENAPDAFYTFPEEMATYADQLAPLDSYFADDMSDLIGIQDASYNGHLYIAPVLLATYGMVYNADILNKIGWDVNKLPTTLAEYDAFLKQCKDAGYQSFIGNYLFDNLSGFSSVVWSKDTDYISLDTGKVEVGSDNKTFVDLYTYLKSWVDNGYTPQESITATVGGTSIPGLADFMDGKYASYYMSGTQIKDPLLQNASFNWVVGPNLKYDASSKSVGIDIVCGFVIPKTSKHVDATAALLKIMTNTENGTAFAEGTGYMPTRKSAGNPFASLKGYDQLAQIYANYDEVRGVVNATQSADFNVILQTRQQILLGQVSIADGLDQLKASLQKDVDLVASGG